MLLVYEKNCYTYLTISALVSAAIAQRHRMVRNIFKQVYVWSEKLQNFSYIRRLEIDAPNFLWTNCAILLPGTTLVDHRVRASLIKDPPRLSETYCTCAALTNIPVPILLLLASKPILNTRESRFTKIYQKLRIYS